LTPYGHRILTKMLAAWSEYTKALDGVISKVNPQ